MAQLPGAPAVEVPPAVEVQRQRPVSASKPGIRRRQNSVAVSFGGGYACEGTPSQATLEQLHDAGAEKLYTTCCIYYDHCDVGKTFNCQLLAVPSQAIFNYQRPPHIITVYLRRQFSIINCMPI